MVENVPQPTPPKKSLGALLAVIALSCVSATAIALLVLPVLRRGHDQSEKHAAAALRAYVSAQAMHLRAAEGPKEYARDLGTLVAKGFVDAALAAARGPNGVPRRGYRFLEPESIAGQPLDWSKDFALCATPANYGGSLKSTFLVGTDGQVWRKDLGRSEFVKDFPAAPAAAGWKPVE
jgi:hypothetical protein